MTDMRQIPRRSASRAQGRLTGVPRGREESPARLRRFGKSGGQGEAFTLIELLTVVAIISLLTSILIPSLVRVRQLAIEVKCVAQLHQLCNAIYMYTNDYEGVLFWRLPRLDSQGMEWFTWVGRETGNTYTNQGDDIFNTTIPRPLNDYVDYAVEIAHDPGDAYTYEIGWAPFGAKTWFEMVGSS